MVGLCGKFLFQRLFYQWWDEAVNGSVEGTDFFDDGRRKVAVRNRSHHEKGFNLLGDAPVHLSDLKFVLKVGDGPQAPDYYCGLLRKYIVYQKSVERVNLCPAI